MLINDLYYYRRAVRKNLSSKFDEFLAVRSQFDGVDFYAHTCYQSVTVEPLFAFYCPLFCMEKIINNVVFRPRRIVYAAVFALDVATALRQINR